MDSNFSTPPTDSIVSAVAAPTSTPFGFIPRSDLEEIKTTSNPAGPSLNPRSCITCRRRKVKCDKREPCSNCTKAQTQCVFPAPGRAPRRPRIGGKASERETELLKRLRKLEGVVEELSGQVEIEATRASPGSDNSSTQKDGESNAGPSAKDGKVRIYGMDEGSGSRKSWIARSLTFSGPSKKGFELEQGFGRLVLDEGKSQYVSSPFWAELAEEVASLREIIDDREHGSDSDDLLAEPTLQPDHQSFVMGYRSSDVDLKGLHPLPSQIPFYWETFKENVDPLVKIMHIPTMNTLMKEIPYSLHSLSKSTEALMFSIYFSAITSMSLNEVSTNFGVSKEILIQKYRFGVEQALAKAGFLHTNEIVTVQAFVLFLVCVRRHDDTRFTWSMTGLVLKLAHALGLHRDGSKFGLSPFNTEMRRRLWWQICILDSRSAEDHGSDPSIFEHTFDTQMPLSINDADLKLDAKEAPQPRVGVSDMTFCLIRYEICALSRRLNYIPPGVGPCRMMPTTLPLEEKEKLIKECVARLETKYLQYCEDAGPLYWVAATVARLIFAKMSLIIYHPLIQPGALETLSADVKDRLFMASIEIIEYSRILETEASTKHWGWLFRTYTPWHAIAYILGELSIRGNSAIVERAWRAVDGVFQDWSVAVSSSKSGMLWQPMRKLMAKARRKREENMKIMGSNTNELGMKSYLIRPLPQGPSGKGAPSAQIISRECPTLGQEQQQKEGDEILITSFFTGPTTVPDTDTTMNMGPQIVGMGTFGPDQIELQLQQQQQANNQQQQTPWLMDDSALLDLDMNGLDGENWGGWDDVVKDFQIVAEDSSQSVDRPGMGGFYGNWW